MKYRVLRPHEGDRMYQPGEIREGSKADLGHLVPNVLEPLTDEQVAAAQSGEMAKAEKSIPNKAEAAPANKAETRRTK